ncbi:MAG TPA: hypothetical protein VN654_09500 [Vicinamibacterales bacterium]|jgi:hypothetical protein|nr:hypothetical protein [Vicinamibacterales bacterium]
MSDVNTFIDAIGKDISATVTPRIDGLVKGIEQQAVSDYGPKVSAFASQLVQHIIDEQSAVVERFVATLIQDLFARYRPEVTGQLRTTIVNGGLQVTGDGVRFDLKRRDTGAVVSSLDIPVSVKIPISALSVTLGETTVGLDLVR